MLREYLKISRGATRLHACKNEVIIERYRMYHYYISTCGISKNGTEIKLAD